MGMQSAPAPLWSCSVQQIAGSLEVLASQQSRGVMHRYVPRELPSSCCQPSFSLHRDMKSRIKANTKEPSIDWSCLACQLQSYTHAQCVAWDSASDVQHVQVLEDWGPL